jgi:hypothetical protein
MSDAGKETRSGRRLVLLAALAAVAGVGMTPFGGWLESFVHGTGTRWRDAYVALESPELSLAADPAQRERLLLALAQADGEPPVGLRVGPRLHAPGILARLRYETYDENGERLETWQVRALVPGIGGEGGPWWEGGCPRPCQEEVERSGGTRLYRSGNPGIAGEWVLRMPVGQTFDLRPQPLQTQDILDWETRHQPLKYVTKEGRGVRQPDRIRVTLEDACPARARAGTALRLEVIPNAAIPIPQGFSTLRWVQLDGCGALAPFPPPPPREPPVRVAVEAPAAVRLEAVLLRRDPASGRAALKVNEAWLRSRGVVVLFQVEDLCRYDAAADRWQRLPAPDPRVSWRLESLPEAEIVRGERTAFELPAETALFWVRWREQEDSARSPRGPYNAIRRDELATSGPVLCNDIALVPEAAGRVAACVPFNDHAQARLVPDPAETCGK